MCPRALATVCVLSQNVNNPEHGYSAHGLEDSQFSNVYLAVVWLFSHVGFILSISFRGWHVHVRGISMNSRYTLADTSSLYTPALLFYKELIQHNIQECLRLAGGADRLRPHCKTHKTRQIVQMLLEFGIAKHKCATLAEAEMLASCGVRD